MITSNTVFSKIANVRKTFLISIVLVDDLLERITGIPLYMFRPVAKLELSCSITTPLPRDKTNIEVATSSSRLDGDFPGLRSEDMHGAKEVNLIDPLWSLETDGALYLANRLWIKMLLHKNRPPSCKGAYVSLHAYVQNICLGVFTTSDPSGPVNHNLLIGYLKSASGLDGDQNGNNHCVEATYCHGQVASIIQQSQSPFHIQC